MQRAHTPTALTKRFHKIGADEARSASDERKGVAHGDEG